MSKKITITKLTEKEKMLKQMLFNSSEAELTFEREKCKENCFEYNNINPKKKKKRMKKIKEIFGKTKKNLNVNSPFYCDYGYNIKVGKNFYMNHSCIILDCGPISFGDNVLCGPQCGFHTVGHPIDKNLRNKGLIYACPITIGNNVWFGAGVQVLPGVTIGDNVVIGAGSVVVKDIPSNVIAVGNPCKVVKKITDKNKDKYKEEF